MTVKLEQEQIVNILRQEIDKILDHSVTFDEGSVKFSFNETGEINFEIKEKDTKKVR